MPDDLRARIVAVLDAELEIGLHLTEKLADAVIRELGLRQEVMDAKEVLNSHGEHWFQMPRITRYVTEWWTPND